MELQTSPDAEVPRKVAKRSFTGKKIHFLPTSNIPPYTTTRMNHLLQLLSALLFVSHRPSTAISPPASLPETSTWGSETYDCFPSPLAARFSLSCTPTSDTPLVHLAASLVACRTPPSARPSWPCSPSTRAHLPLCVRRTPRPIFLLLVPAFFESAAFCARNATSLFAESTHLLATSLSRLRDDRRRLHAEHARLLATIEAAAKETVTLQNAARATINQAAAARADGAREVAEVSTGVAALEDLMAAARLARTPATTPSPAEEEADSTSPDDAMGACADAARRWPAFALAAYLLGALCALSAVWWARCPPLLLDLLAFALLATAYSSVASMVLRAAMLILAPVFAVCLIARAWSD